MEIVAAIRDQAEEHGWTPTRVAIVAGVGENAVRKWYSGITTPGGPSVLSLMRNMPGLAERLGFAPPSESTE